MIKIGFAAFSGEPTNKERELARRFIKRLYKKTSFKNLVFLLGGYWGLMKYIVDMLLDLNGTVILFPPLELEEIEYPDKAIVLKLGLSMRTRSIPLVRSSDLFIVMGGESGSILELITAYTEGKKTYLITDTGHSTDNFKQFSPYLDIRKTTKIHVYNDPETLADDIADELMNFHLKT